jgi:hypothetical protein
MVELLAAIKSISNKQILGGFGSGSGSTFSYSWLLIKGGKSTFHKNL